MVHECLLLVKLKLLFLVKARLTSGGILVQAPPFVSQSLSRPQQGVDRVKQKLQQTRLGHHEVLNPVVYCFLPAGILYIVCVCVFAEAELCPSHCLCVD